MNADQVPASVKSAFGFDDCTFEAIEIGLINRTFRVARNGHPVAVLQKQHPTFGPAVNDDIDRVTKHLARAGVETTRIVRTLAGETSLSEGGMVFRALTYVEGHSTSKVEKPKTAFEGAKLAGLFHRAMADFSGDFAFKREGVHDTELHFRRLERALESHKEHRHFAEAAHLAHEIFAHGREFVRPRDLPLRVVHGDLKISNILFDENFEEARVLVDLDTVAHGSIDAELGDAFRSWCNRGPEDANAIHIDRDVFRAAVFGYASSAHDLLVQEEWDSLVYGFERISCELSSRFCADILQESYFGWDSKRYAEASDHHLARAKAQLALSKRVKQEQSELEAIVKEAQQKNG